MAGEFDEIRGRLEAIAEELADLAIVRLRESIDAGGDDCPSTNADSPGPAGPSRRRPTSSPSPTTAISRRGGVAPTAEVERTARR